MLEEGLKSRQWSETYSAKILSRSIGRLEDIVKKVCSVELIPIGNWTAQAAPLPLDPGGGRAKKKLRAERAGVTAVALVR